MKKFTATSISLIYMTILGATAILNMRFPSQTANIINFFLPIRIDLSEQPFIRYRVTLFLVATITLVIFALIIGWIGFRYTNVEKIKRIHWIYFIVAMLLISTGWIVYPFMSLCTTCWSSNDLIYFFLTVSFFIALQLFLQAIFLRFNIFRGD